MKNILWISPYAPYDSIPHAGGQIENFYLKYLFNNYKDGKLCLISECMKDELDKVQESLSGIDSKILVPKKDVKSKILRMFRYNLLESKYSPFNKYGNYLSNELMSWILLQCKELKKSGYSPAVIILQWTQCVVLITKIKNIFPMAKYICIEEDVAYLNLKRNVELKQNPINCFCAKMRYLNLKKSELKAVNSSDIVICNNQKDKALLIDENISSEKIYVWCPYYRNSSFKNIYNVYAANSREGLRVIYYGAMFRKENYWSAEWLIKNVLPIIKDTDISIYIIGSKPVQELKEMENEKVHIVGFVDDINEYFSNCICMAAPLVLGAGIKIKILEAMALGVPTLTNEIGIEGIPAQNEKDYLFCDSAQSYADNIRKLVSDIELRKLLSVNSVNFVKENFNIDKSAETFVNLVKML